VLLAFSKNLGAFHFGYVFETYFDELACFFEIVSDFDVVVVVRSLEHGLLDVYVDLCAFESLVAQYSFYVSRVFGLMILHRAFSNVVACGRLFS
jgi:hypothetical protein